MSEAPKRIWANMRRGWFQSGALLSGDDTEYIRADLVTALLPYAKHHMTCAWHVGHIDGECTCGLTKIREELK